MAVRRKTKARRKSSSGIKNKWVFAHGFYNTRNEVVLRFDNKTSGAKFAHRVVEIPQKGAIKFQYQTLRSLNGWKNFTRKRTPALLAKYRPFKNRIKN